MSRVLCFDHGQKKIGVAVGNCKTFTSQGLNTIPARSGIPIQNLIEQLIKTWQPNRLIIGLPLQADGHVGVSASAAKTFGKRLTKITGLPIDYVDERLSTNHADKLLREIRPKNKSLKRLRLTKRDSLAAELILKTYFQTIQ